MEFLNPDISLSELPKVEKVDFHSIDRKYLTLSMISTVLFWGFVFILGFILISVNKSWVNESLLTFVLPVCAVIIVGQLLLIWLGFRKKLYALRKHDILYQTGLIWHKTIAIPFNRIQHCSVHQGPVARYFGLAQLHVFTAGGSGSDLTISGPDRK